jgi:excisionase family DNA binding protein
MNHDADFTDEQLLLTTVQAARVLGVGRTTVYQLIKTGDLHPVHIARSCRISWAELERYVARLDAANQPAPPPTATPTPRRWRRTTDASGQRSLFAVDSPDPDDDHAA